MWPPTRNRQVSTPNQQIPKYSARPHAPRLAKAGGALFAGFGLALAGAKAGRGARSRRLPDEQLDPRCPSRGLRSTPITRS